VVASIRWVTASERTANPTADDFRLPFSALLAWGVVRPEMISIPVRIRRDGATRTVAIGIGET
jgi:hypothetical protein